jgi:hypothetical protein
VRIAVKPIYRTCRQPDSNTEQKRKTERKEWNMKNRPNTNLIIRSILAFALALAIWAPVQARSVEPAEGKMMTEAKMMERCQEMMGQKQKMMEDMKAQDAELTEQLTRMNSAPEDKKLALIAAVVTRMAEQRTAMNARMSKMQEEMMQHMMEHMQQGKGSMSQCPMMKGMKDMEEKSAGAHKEHQKEQK